ncbi:MAG TPA: hypothetical protein VF533_19915 [Solirubrobacteraceae bacterium]|jgi:hypothetical protein
MAVNDQPWWYQGCLDNIAKILPAGTNVMCPKEHCDSTTIKNYAETYCTCQPPYCGDCCPGDANYPGCCKFTQTSPLPVADDNCFCCCSCMANNTPIAYSATQYRAIEDYEVGDRVYVAGDVSLSSWSEQIVRFSAGAAGGTNTMIKVAFGDANSSDYLLVSRGQPFLMPDRKLKTVETLVPGKDSLVSFDGTERPVLSLEAGQFNYGLHHIATSLGAATSPADHLLLAKGIVCGDWALQVALMTTPPDELGFVEGQRELPELGTRAYGEAYSDLDHTATLAALPGVEHAQPDAAEFTAFGSTPGVYIPEHADSFLTQEQAWEIETNGQQAPITAESGEDILDYLFAIHRGFFPDVVFYLDVENQLPNAYSFEEYDRRMVIITGGLIRMRDIGQEGMALVIAHCIGRFTGGKPLDEQGCSCTGQADYAAVAGVLPSVWNGLQWVPVAKAGIAQIGALFALVKQHRGGSNACADPALDCRLAAMNAPLEMMPLPNCAGGPPDPALAVTGATGATGTPHGQVSVSFNLALDRTTAQQVANYQFEPTTKTYDAALGRDGQSVQVAADVVEGIEYTLTVTDVLSAEQAPLDPGQGTANFTATGGN